MEDIGKPLNKSQEMMYLKAMSQLRDGRKSSQSSRKIKNLKV